MSEPESGLHILTPLCNPCPRGSWCAKTFEKLCLIPPDSQSNARFWQLNESRVKVLGGVQPRRIPDIAEQLDLPQIISIYGDRGHDSEVLEYPIGISAADVIAFHQTGCPLNQEYLTTRGIQRCQKVLHISAKDELLNRLSENIGEEFFESMQRPDVIGIITPNYSAYRHTEHQVWVDNRALGQNFMDSLLKRGLPGIFHCYLEDSRQNQDWLTEYFSLNPTQHILATGFDRRAANNYEFVVRRLDLLVELESRIGRPLKIILSNILTRLPAIKAAAERFPGRIHLIGESIFLRAINGSLLVRTGHFKLGWQEKAPEFSNGRDLFLKNMLTLEESIREFVPTFYAENKTDQRTNRVGSVNVRHPKTSISKNKTSVYEMFIR